MIKEPLRCPFGGTTQCSRGGGERGVHGCVHSTILTFCTTDLLVLLVLLVLRVSETLFVTIKVARRMRFSVHRDRRRACLPLTGAQRIKDGGVALVCVAQKPSQIALPARHVDNGGASLRFSREGFHQEIMKDGGRSRRRCNRCRVATPGAAGAPSRRALCHPVERRYIHRACVRVRTMRIFIPTLFWK